MAATSEALTVHSEPGAPPWERVQVSVLLTKARKQPSDTLCDQGQEMHYTAHLSQVQMLTDSGSDEKIHY